VPVDGAPFRGELTAVDARWQLTLAVEGKTRVLPAADLVAWGRFCEPAKGPLVLLADGSLLPAKVPEADKDNLAIDSLPFGRQKVPLETLAGIAFHLPSDQQDRDRLLDRVLHATGDADRLLLINGDEVTGLVETLDAETVTIRAAVGPLKVETSRIAAVVFNPTLRQAVQRPPLTAWVGLSDGSRLLAGKLLLDDASLRVTTLTGQTWKTAAKELVALQPLGGRAVYLSDLKPAAFRYTPFLGDCPSFRPSENGTVPLGSAEQRYLPWPYRADRNATGGGLRCGGRLYLKGLGTHSKSQLTYALEPSHRRFEAELGIDDSTDGGGSVQFRVLLDGREKFASQTIRGSAPPATVSVDLAGAKTLELVVDYADRGDVLDRAGWLDARLVK
jgi:hypothetical protein